MARTSQVSVDVYRRHIALYRFINDSFIFPTLIRKHLGELADDFGRRNPKAKKKFKVPKKDGAVLSARRNSELKKLLLFQKDCGLYQSLIVSIVSRVEAFLIECLKIVITQYPEKLSLLVDDKSGVPLEVFSSLATKEDILTEMIRWKSESLTFLPPAKYIEKLQNILSIRLNDSTVADFIEIKASRDIIVHGTGVINSTYATKAGDHKRGDVGDALPVDLSYFVKVIGTCKLVSGNVAREVEAQFG
jgi:hypothetical protein